MALSPGVRLGAYEIVCAIGAGGMGEVYRARDTRLNRDIAIKVLPEPLALDPDRLARLNREAQLLATLNHPEFGRPVEFSRMGRIEFSPASNRRWADAMPDGEHVIGVTTATPQSVQTAQQITVVLNWFDEVRQKAPAR